MMKILRDGTGQQKRVKSVAMRSAPLGGCGGVIRPAGDLLHVGQRQAEKRKNRRGFTMTTKEADRRGSDEYRVAKKKTTKKWKRRKDEASDVTASKEGQKAVTRNIFSKKKNQTNKI